MTTPDFLFSPARSGAGAAEAGRGVAVVMRTRDRPLLLRRALASVIGQTHRDWHLYVVNDGGDRAALDAVLAEQQQALSGRITVIHNDASRGMEAASNQALAASDHAYFGVHDDDDSWEPGFLAATTELLSRPDQAGFVGVVTGWSDIYEVIEDGAVTQEQEFQTFQLPALTDLTRLLAKNETPPIAVLFRTSLLQDLHGYNDKLPVLGDWDFNLRAMMVGDIAEIPQVLAHYHLRHKAEDQYSNSVFAGKATHAHYSRRIRNEVVRRALAQNPDIFGVLQPVLHSVANIHQQVKDEVDRLRNGLNEQWEKRRDEIVMAVQRDMVLVYQEQRKAQDAMVSELVKLIVQQGNANATRIEQSVRSVLDLLLSKQ